MYGSFLSFTKQELKTCALLRTFSEVTSLLRVIVSLVKIAYSAKNTYVKDAGTEDTNARIAKGTDIGGSWVKSAYIKTFYTRSRNLMSGNSYICGSAYKSSESFIWGLRLLAELTSKMPINSSLCSQVNLDKVL